MALLPFAIPSRCDGDEPAGERFAVQLRVVQNLLSSINRDSSVAIVRFATDTYEPIQQKPGSKIDEERVPKTGVHQRAGMNQFVFAVCGKITILRPLQNTIRLHGQINEDIPLESILAPRIGGGQFRALQPHHDHVKPVDLLMIEPRKVKSLADVTFIGPLSPEDVNDLTAVAKRLAKQPFFRISKDDAREALRSPNPWLIYVGLLRLDHLKALTAADFRVAAEALPSEISRWAIEDLFAYADRQHPHVRAGLTEELSTLFRDAPPEKQAALIRAVADYAKRNIRPDVAHGVNVPALQQAARAYRATIAGDRDRRAVVAALDELLTNLAPR